MRFMMLVCTDRDPDPKSEAAGEVEAWVEENDRRGTRVLGDRLVGVAEAKTVRVRGGRRMVTDGPFAETAEVILGFDILECDSLEEAIAIAANHPVARTGRIEVRAFWQA